MISIIIIGSSSNASSIGLRCAIPSLSHPYPYPYSALHSAPYPCPCPYPYPIFIPICMDCVIYHNCPALSRLQPIPPIPPIPHYPAYPDCVHPYPAPYPCPSLSRSMFIPIPLHVHPVLAALLHIRPHSHTCRYASVSPKSSDFKASC